MRAPSTSAAGRERSAAGERRGPGENHDREMRRLGGERRIVVDARATRNYAAADIQAAGAVRVAPDDPVRDATEQRLSKHATLVVYCA